jgi:hypothetical protein
LGNSKAKQSKLDTVKTNTTKTREIEKYKSLLGILMFLSLDVVGRRRGQTWAEECGASITWEAVGEASVIE